MDRLKHNTLHLEESCPWQGLCQGGVIPVLEILLGHLWSMSYVLLNTSVSDRHILHLVLSLEAAKSFRAKMGDQVGITIRGEKLCVATN